jgi:ribosomal protein S21
MHWGQYASGGFSFYRHRVSRTRHTMMGVRIVLTEGETIGQAFSGFRKLLERHGATREMRRHKYLIKPTQTRRAKKFGKRFKARQATLLAKIAGEQPVSSISESTESFWRRTGKP